MGEKSSARRIVRVSAGDALVLRQSGVPFVVAEENREVVERLREAGTLAISGDAADPAVLVQTHVARARILIIAIPDHVRVRRIMDLARKLNPLVELVVRTHSDEEHEFLDQERLATVFMGELAGARSPGRAFSPMVGAELLLAAGRPAAIPLDPGFEHAIVPLSGACRLEDRPLAIDTLYYLGCDRRELRLAADGEPARLLLIGGAPFGETILMWWNFVARTPDEIVAARADWEAGRRFGEVRGYAGARLEAPAFLARPVPR